MIKDVNPSIIQYVAIMGSLILIISILLLIRNKKIKEKFSLLWLFFGIIFLFLSIWRDSLEIIARMLGIAYAPAALFLILIIAIISILIHFSMTITRLENNITDIVQETGLLKMEIGNMKKRSDGSASTKRNK